MKKIFQLIFSNTPRSALTPEKIEIARGPVESPDSMPGNRTDLNKRQLSSAPVEMEAPPGRM
jgi:hypothetical protein